MNLLLTGCFNYTTEQLDAIRSLGYQVFFMESEKYDDLPLPAELVDATVCNYLFTTNDFDKFKNLKLIQLTSAGFDRVPVDKIKAKGCRLFNAKGVYSTPMAEWALFRVLERYKQGWFFKSEQEKKCWTKNRGIKEIFGTKVAIIGAGNIGSEVARRFKSFGANIDGYDIHTNCFPGFDNMFLIDTLKQNIGKYDVVILTAPLLPSTKGIMSKDILKSLKNEAIIVNISRGAIIDEQALIEVLSDRQDLFAALDVFEQEPLSENNPLWTMPNVAISPHNSFVSNGNNSRMYNVIYTNLREFICEVGIQ